LKTTPTALKTLRKLPWQAGQTVSASSVKLCRTSSASPQSVHWYWYVGTVPFPFRPLALVLLDC
jgi:hypothetical protein